MVTGSRSRQDSAQNLLAVLVSPNILTVWNTDTGTRVNRIIFSESVLSFTFNPFQPEQLLRELEISLYMLYIECEDYEVGVDYFDSDFQRN